MSYTGRRRFTTAREKNTRTFKQMKAAIVICLIFLAIYVFMNRVSIIDYWSTYFY